MFNRLSGNVGGLKVISGFYSILLHLNLSSLRGRTPPKGDFYPIFVLKILFLNQNFIFKPKFLIFLNQHNICKQVHALLILTRWSFIVTSCPTVHNYHPEIPGSWFDFPWICLILWKQIPYSISLNWRKKDFCEQHPV